MEKVTMTDVDKAILLAIHECWPETPTLGEIREVCELMDITWNGLSSLHRGKFITFGTDMEGTPAVKMTTKGRLVAGFYYGTHALIAIESYPVK